MNKISKINWKFGTYNGELKEEIPHGNGKYERTDENGTALFEGKFDRGNPTNGKLEFNSDIFFWVDFSYWRYLKNFDKEKNKKRKQLYDKVIFKGTWRKARENLVYISHGVNRSYQGLEEIDFFEFEQAEYFRDRFGAIYSGKLKKGQVWRPDGYGTLKYPDGLILDGNFIPKGVTTESDGYFEGKAIYPDGKITKIKDSRNIFDQFTDWFYD